MEINFGRASKFYAPGESVTGMILFKDIKFDPSRHDLNIKAESLMDTVSQIRGNMGRPPLDEKDKIYFMKKKAMHKEPKTTGQITVSGKTFKSGRAFEFTLESTEEGEKLLDSYVGVEFSVVVSTYSDSNILSTVQSLRDDDRQVDE